MYLQKWFSVWTIFFITFVVESFLLSVSTTTNHVHISVCLQSFARLVKLPSSFQPNSQTSTMQHQSL